MPAVSLHAAFRSANISPTLAMNERARALEHQGRRIFKFGFGQSPFAPPAFVAQVLKDRAAEKDYLPVAGIPELREAVASYHNRQGIECSANDILIGPGSKQLMFLLFFVLETPEVLIPAPSWVSYAPQAKMLGRKVRWIQTTYEDGWRLRPEQLADAQAGSILVLNYPNNPTGLTYSEDELQSLASEARRRSLWILSDEIYAELHHLGLHRSIACHYPEGTFVTAGLSKWCGAGGWRVGTLRIPAGLDAIRAALTIAASETHSCVAAPMQYAALAAYSNHGAAGEYLCEIRSKLRGLGGDCVRILREAGIAVHDAQCAFYLFPDFTPCLAGAGYQDSNELCRKLLEDTGVALLAGTAFGQPAHALQARLAYVEDPDKTREGAALVARWVRDQIRV